MKRPGVFLMIIFLCSTSLSGQKLSLADSLMLQLNETDSDTMKVNLMNGIAEEWAERNPALSMEYAQKALNISMDVNFEPGICKSCIIIAENYRNQNAHNKAYEFFHKALNNAENINNRRAIAEISNALGMISFEMNNLAKSLHYHYRSVKLYFELNDKAGLATTYSHIGKTYKKQKKYDQALNIFNKALYIDRSLKNIKRTAENYGNVGSVMLQNNDPESKTFFEQQILTAEQYQDTTNLATGNYYMATYYQWFGKSDSAIPYYKNAIKLFTSLENMEWMSRVYKNLSDIMASKGLYDEAYQYLSKHEQYRDSLKTEQMARLIAQQETKYTFFKQLKEQKLAYEKRSQLIMFVTIFLLILVLSAGLYFFTLRKKIAAFNAEKQAIKDQNKKTEEALERKKREHTTQSMYQIHKNENLQQITNKLKKARIHFKKQNYPLLDEIIRDLDNCAHDMVWEEFEKRFEEVHTGFYKKLNYRFPNLTTNDKRLCAFLRMNMTTKEIANITRQTPNSIEVGRTRLRKKLNLCNKDISFGAFLTQL